MAFPRIVDLRATFDNLYNKAPATPATLVKARSAAVNGVVSVSNRPRTAFGVVLAAMAATTVARVVAKRRLARQEAAAKTARARAVYAGSIIVNTIVAVLTLIAKPFVYAFNRLFPKQTRVESAKAAVKSATNKAINAKDATVAKVAARIPAKVKAVAARNPRATTAAAVTFGFLAARTMRNHVVPAVSSAASTLATKAGEFSRRNIVRPA